MAAINTATKQHNQLTTHEAASFLSLYGIDVNEKIWLIEANSQSTKVSLEKAYDEAVLSRAYRNILEYARYLPQQNHDGR